MENKNKETTNIIKKLIASIINTIFLIVVFILWGCWIVYGCNLMLQDISKFNYYAFLIALLTVLCLFMGGWIIISLQNIIKYFKLLRKK